MSVILTCVAGTLLVIGSGLVLHLLAQVDALSRTEAPATSREYVAPRRAA